jgi:hypothetical protein
MATADGKVHRYPIPSLHSDSARTHVNYFSGGFMARDNQPSFSRRAADNGFAIVETHITAAKRRSSHLY